MAEHQIEWDDIIIGAGSAGAVLAARLSEDPGRRVLLIEAGRDFAGVANIPKELKNPGEPVYSGFNWKTYANLSLTNRWRDIMRSDRQAASGAGRSSPAFTAAVSDDRSLALRPDQFPYFVGKVVGGSSAINGAMAMRGVPDDFDQWVRAGNPAWTWEQVLPYYRKIESDADFHGPVHGSGGPLPIARARDDEITPFQQAFMHACLGLGMAQIDDLNADGGAGVGKLPMNVQERVRISTAIAYLESARSRPNLEIQSCCTAQRLLFDGARVIGIQVETNENVKVLRGRRITLSAGAIHTPMLLQLSGIGNARLCRSLGIGPRVDLRGVGENLSDHAAVVIWAIPTDGVIGPSGYTHQAMARVASAPGSPHDLQLLPMAMREAESFPYLGGMLRSSVAVGLSVMLSQPMSRGRVFIEDALPGRPPVIELGLCSDPRDIERLMHGIRVAWKLLHSPPLAKCIDKVFLWAENIVNDDRLLRKAVVKFISAVWHPVGTARMGPAADPMAVVDERLRVHGVDGLHVVDASVMPVMPRAPTNLTCVMIAERAAEWMMA
jgi:choline dehydrogenase